MVSPDIAGLDSGPTPCAMALFSAHCCLRVGLKQGEAADQLERRRTPLFWPLAITHRRSGRQRARPPWAVSAMGEWCWRPLTATCETQIPLPFALADVQASPDRGLSPVLPGAGTSTVKRAFDTS